MFVVGLVYVVAALIGAFIAAFPVPSRSTRPKEHDREQHENTTGDARLFTGVALMATAFVIVVLFGHVVTDALFSDSASSVSNAPGP